MKLSLATRRTLWWPTRWGWLGLCLLLVSPIALWCFGGEAFFGRTSRQAEAEVLVVEGWIGTEAVRAAAAEFLKQGQRYVVATGGLTSDRWSERRWSYADMTGRELIRCGVPADRVIYAQARTTDVNRTYEMALAAWEALDTRHIQPKAVNVFTHSVHARRSRLVFQRVFGDAAEVGVVAWQPPGFGTGAWWRSSQRASDLVKESAAFAYEALFHSGRPRSEHPPRRSTDRRPVAASPERLSFL